MGRAIDMENDIGKLRIQVDRIDAALAKVIDVVDSMQEKGQRTTHVDLVEDVSPEEVPEEKPKSKKSSETTTRPKKD